MEKVNLNRQVFNKQKFNDTVDTKFSELGVQEPDLNFFDINLATVDDFFILYNKLFFGIPKEGAINSHTFLVKESGDYIGSQQANEEIQALLQEIADIREENLELRKENIEFIKTIYPSKTSPKKIDTNQTNEKIDTNQTKGNKSNISFI
jgi:hypothetical protein